MQKRQRKWRWAAGLAAIALAAATAAGAQERLERHSGVILSVADDARSFVLGEVGPWQLRNGETVVTRVTIALAPDTQYAIAARREEAPSGFAGDFVETAVGPDQIYENDYVTVVARREGPRRLVAVKITAVEGLREPPTMR